MRVPRNEILAKGNTFHKIWRCHDRQWLLQSHGEKHAFLKSIYDDYKNNCSRDDFVIYGYTMMSNHGHEANGITGKVKSFSDHMRRAHGFFGQMYNKRHDRLGKVAHGRPKTLRVQDDDRLKELMFYIDCNPVRAKIIKHPTDIRWKEFSSCRFYCYGERNSYSEMLTVPEWYKKLGKNSKQRQRKYRSMLDKYLVKKGMKRDPKMSWGHFIGGELWVNEERKRLSAALKKKSKDSSGSDPPDSS
jgi:REP element-mobilizing transposase RayT